MSKAFSQACENNKAAILSVISRYFQPGTRVLEIGSYTTQHIQFFASSLPEVTWQPADMPESISLVHTGLEGVDLPNLLPPAAIDVSDEDWHVSNIGGIFSANTLHIMSESDVTGFFRGAGQVLQTAGYLCVYGPFRYRGEYTSESNAEFDEWLKARDPASGVRDFERVDGLARQADMALVCDHSMPANNQLLVWQKMI